jgi:hypothetical protein
VWQVAGALHCFQQEVPLEYLPQALNLSSALVVVLDTTWTQQLHPVQAETE